MKAYTESEHNAAMDRLAADLEAAGCRGGRRNPDGSWDRVGGPTPQPVGALLACIADDRQRAMYQAAPDLAEALRDLLLDGHSGAGLGRVARDRARAALAKAGL